MLTFNICPETAVQLIVGVGSSVLALLLMLIKIPQSDYSAKLTNSKVAIVISFLICSFVMYYSMAQYGDPEIWDWEMFTMLAIYIVVHFSTSIVSYSMIALLNTKMHRSKNLFIPGLFVSMIISFMLLEAYKSQNMNYFWTMCITALSAFLIQSITYIVYFDKTYKQSVKELESYYDEDERHKLKWVRFCYIITMLTNIFILVYLCLYWFLEYKLEIASIYTVWYLLYMLYLTANFISFLGSHRLVLDAVAHKVLDGSVLPKRPAVRKKEKASERHFNVEREFAKLDKAIKEWVETKRFCEYDKTREQVAQELNTSKEVLNMYFTGRIGVDFRTWRTNLRIEEAKKMLLESDDVSISIVSESAGFSDKSNFHRQFVKLVGCSPKVWRDTKGQPDRI